MGNFAPEVAKAPEPPPCFRIVVVHRDVGLNFGRVFEAMDSLEPVERLCAFVHRDHPRIKTSPHRRLRSTLGESEGGAS
jgi:hypothetical protein